MNKKFIYILGTGRCGTVSLVTLLNEQRETDVTHEQYRLAWNGRDLISLGMAIERMRSREKQTVGDCGFWYVNYVKAIIEYGLGKSYFVCLKRDRDQTVKSYLHKTLNTNYWTKKNSKHFDISQISSWEWYRCYPHYNLPKKNALCKYYDNYYKKAMSLAAACKNFRIFDMNSALNNINFQEEMLRFLGFDRPVLKQGIWLNKGRHNDRED